MSGVTYPTVSGVRKIAVLRPSALGDFIFSLPALHGLKRAYPDARIVYIGRQWHADFLSGRPGPVDEVVVIPPCPGVGAPPDGAADPAPLQCFIEAMQQAQFDLALQMFGGGRYSNPLVLQFGARLTVGMKARYAAPLDRWIAYRALQNRRLQLLEVVSLARAGLVQLGTELAVTGRDRQQAAQVLPDQPDQRLVLLHPGATDRRRCWPAACFAAVADMLANEGARIAVSGSAAEASVVREVIQHMRCPAIDLSGRLPLPALCGALEKSALLVSNDTGPLHLALAIGTPCVGIYWLSNLVESGPLRQHLHAPAVSARTDCPVCGMANLTQRCAHDVSFVTDVTVEHVCKLARELFYCTPAEPSGESAAS